MDNKNQTYFCESCGQPLNPKTMVWLELSWKTNLYTDPNVVKLDGPEQEGGESQGGFTFGPDCAKRILKNGGEDTKPYRWR